MIEAIADEQQTGGDELAGAAATRVLTAVERCNTYSQPTRFATPWWEGVMRSVGALPSRDSQVPAGYDVADQPTQFLEVHAPSPAQMTQPTLFPDVMLPQLAKRAARPEPEGEPYPHGTPQEHINTSKDWAVKCWLAGKVAVAGWLRRVRGIEPGGQASPVADVPGQDVKPWQSSFPDFHVHEKPAKLADKPEAFSVVDTDDPSRDLSQYLSPETRQGILLVRIALAAGTAFRAAMDSKPSLTPDFTDPEQAEFLREGLKAYEEGDKPPLSFEEFMAWRRASDKHDCAQRETRAAYERGELKIVVAADANAIRQLHELDLAAQASERYFEDRIRQEGAGSRAVAMRDAMRDRVFVARRELVAKMHIA